MVSGIAKTFWSVPAYLPDVQIPLPPDLIAAAEARLGVTLPKAYLELLQVQNGGSPRWWPEDIPSAPICGIGDGDNSLLADEWWRSGEEDPVPGLDDPDPLIPFAGDGHWYLCLDYRRDRHAEPPVVYLDLEGDEALIETVAESFADFIGLCQPGGEDEEILLGICDDADLATCVAQLDALLGTVAHDAGAYGQGYQLYHYQLRGGGVWVSSNRVPRGFVRRDHRDYDLHKDRMPGTALRFPEWPQVRNVVNCASEALREALRGILSRAGHVTVLMDDPR